MERYPADPKCDQRALIVLAHGAGAGQQHPFMVRYARGLAERGVTAVTFDFPYMAARKGRPDPAAVLEDAFRGVIRDVAARPDARTVRLFIGGKSMGGRIATHLAAAPEQWPVEADPLAGVIALGYPLNPPGGRGRQDRVSHLLAINVPALIVQGTRDSFGGPADLRAALQDRQPRLAIHEVPTGDHSFAVLKSAGKTQAEVDGEILDAIVNWMAATASSLPRTRSGA